MKMTQQDILMDLVEIEELEQKIAPGEPSMIVD
jgi:hypothetical protein